MQPGRNTAGSVLVPRYSQVETETRDRLAARHLPLVRRLCERYRYSGVAVEDLVQIGCIGLLKAIDKFDPDRGSEFLAFAVPVIMGEVKNFFRDHGWSVKIPRKLQRNKQIVEKAVERLNQTEGRSPTVPEIAEVTDLTEQEVYDTLEVGNFGKPLSLEAEYEQNGNGDASSFLDYLGDDDSELDVLADRIDLLNTISVLDDREQTAQVLRRALAVGDRGPSRHLPDARLEAAAERARQAQAEPGGELGRFSARRRTPVPRALSEGLVVTSTLLARPSSCALRLLPHLMVAAVA